MQHINSFSGGMKRGIDYSIIPQDSYSFMLNGYLVSKDEHGYIVTTIKGNKEIAEFSNLECPIGSITFDGILYIITHKIVPEFDTNIEYVSFYTIKGSNGNEWYSNDMKPLPYIVDDINVGLSIPCSVIGFNRNKLIEIIAKESYDGSVDLYLCDGLNLNVIINTGIDKNGKYTSRKYSTLSDIKLFMTQKSINKIPNVFGSIKTNGYLKPGTYYVYLRYTDDSLNATPFIKEVGPFMIHSGSTINKNVSGVLNENNARINKSIKLSITNGDPNYKKVEVGIVYFYGFNDVVSRDNYLLNKVYTLNSNNACNIIINGNNDLRDLLLEELVTDNIQLDISETQTQYNDRYVGANWKSANMDMSKLAKLAKLFIPHAVIKDYTNLGYADNNNFNQVADENTKEFEYLEDEIYPFGISFLIDGQYKTDVFPICGWYEGIDKMWDEFKVQIDQSNPAEAETINDIDNNIGLFKFPNKKQINGIDVPNYKGAWDFYEPYELDDIVVLNAVYYKVIAESADQKLPTHYPANWEVYIPIDNEIHYKLMGVEMITEYAKAYFNNPLNGPFPNITGIYIMQGKRQENFILQGLSIATTHAVGFSTKFGTNGIIDISQFTEFGDGDTLLHFPYLDASNYPLFPVMTIHTASPFTEKIFYQPVSSVSQLRVGNSEELDIDDNELVEFLAYPITDGVNNDLFRLRSSAWTILNNLTQLKTTHFAIFSPDILLNKNLNITDCYVKPIGIFNKERITNMTHTNILDDAKYSIYTGQKKSFSGLNNYWYNEVFPRVLNQSLNSEFGTVMDFVTENNIYAEMAKIINENETLSINNGFISRMKSIYEVYGEDRNSEETSNSLNQFLTTNRTDLMNSGIILNKNKISNSNSNNTLPIIDIHQDETTSKVFYRIQPILTPENNNNQLPYLCSNLSMKCTPYLGIKYASDKYYQYGNTDQELHNSLVNVYKYGTVALYIAAIEDEYDILSEEYSIINSINDWVNSTIETIFKGDVFSQKTFMRINRWTEEIETYIDKYSTVENWEYGWKQGTAMNIYLQTVKNPNLRVPTFDSTFLPYAYGMSEKGSLEVEKDFVWKSSLNHYMNESWITNSGYDMLKGIIKLPAFDELQLQVNTNKPNRIQWSNKNVSGAFVDQFRQFPIGQYQDIGFDSGEILKLVTMNNILYSIQKYGINQHFSSNKLQSTNDSSDIILGDKEIISNEYKKLSDFGTQHKESIIIGDKGIYGVDWNKERIWRIKNGQNISEVEPLETSKIFMDVFKWFKTIRGNNDPLPNAIYGEHSTGIHTVYDELNKQILFTFLLGSCLISDAITIDGVAREAIYDDISYTLSFSEEFDYFNGFYAYNKNIYIKFDNRLLSFSKWNNKLWEHNIGDYQSIDGTIQPFVIEFIINGLSKEQNVVQYEKEFLSHIINSSPDDITCISWETEYQESDKNPFINPVEFWSNPEYVEHNWNVPIIPKSNSNQGPKSILNFNTFEPSSYMRGQWLKVRITYNPEPGTSQEHQFYIKNIITNLIISFS